MLYFRFVIADSLCTRYRSTSIQISRHLHAGIGLQGQGCGIFAGIAIWSRKSNRNCQFSIVAGEEAILTGTHRYPRCITNFPRTCSSCFARNYRTFEVTLIACRTERPETRGLCTEFNRLRTSPNSVLIIICYFLRRTAYHLIRNELNSLKSSIEIIIADIGMSLCSRRSYFYPEVATLSSQVRISVGKRPTCEIRTIIRFRKCAELRIRVDKTGSQEDIAPTVITHLRRISASLRIAGIILRRNHKHLTTTVGGRSRFCRQACPESILLCLLRCHTGDVNCPRCIRTHPEYTCQHKYFQQ